MLHTKKTTLLAKIETTAAPGTDTIPTVAANAIMAFDVSLDIKPNMEERYPGNSDRSAYPNIRGETAVELKFWIELKGSGTKGTAPRWAPLLKACDRLETTLAGTSNVYSPALVSETCSIYVNIDGILHKILGCAGDCEIDLTSGKTPRLNFTMSGIYALATDSEIAAGSFDDVTPNIVKGTTMTFGTYAAITEKILLKFGNTVIKRTSMNATEGILAFMVGPRNPSGILTCEVVLRATSSADFLSYFDVGTTRALSFVLGTTAGNIVTITAPVCRLSAPKYGDRDGLRIWDIEFQMARSVGNDERSLALT
jgi:hypothetical protein